MEEVKQIWDSVEVAAFNLYNRTFKLIFQCLYLYGAFIQAPRLVSLEKAFFISVQFVVIASQQLRNKD